MERSKTRKKVLKVYGIASILFFVLIGATAPAKQPTPILEESKPATSASVKKQSTPSPEEIQKKQEEQKQQQQAKVDKLRSIIHVSKVQTSNPNSAGGVDLHVVWQNTSDKVVKYCYFSAVPYNAVNDAVKCDIKRTSEYTGKVTGPINSNEWSGEGKRWQNAWYNNTIVRAELTNIRVEYMDGTTENISKSDIKDVMY